MIVSYAQNFEDVILWRALRHVENGFYIDIGAADPVLLSVSLSFYEAGWRGVHVEPVPAYAAALRAARPGEEVIEAIVAATAGTQALHMTPGSGLSTGCAAVADRNAAAGFEVTQLTVRSLPLSDILSRYGDRDIHWLKIDVEGMEQAVLDSWGTAPARPWIIVIESTLPLSQQPSFADWEPRVLALGYDFVYSDGLNRYYLSENKPELAMHFGSGPNVFDNFQLTETSQFVAKLAGALKASKAECDHYRVQLDATLASASWRVTRPLRLAGRAVRILRQEPANFGAIAWRLLVAPFRSKAALTRDILAMRPSENVPSTARVEWNDTDVQALRDGLPPPTRLIFDHLTAARGQIQARLHSGSASATGSA